MTTLLVSLIILGIVFYFIGLIPMASPFPEIIRAVAIILAIIIVLNALGVHIFPGLSLT